MDARSKNLFRDQLDARNSEVSSKTKVGHKGKTFHFEKGNMYRVGQDNKLSRCLTTLEAHIVLKELHERVVGGHFATYIIAKKILDVGYWWPTLFKDIHDFCKSCDTY
jgi:hypothetical protein